MLILSFGQALEAYEQAQFSENPYEGLGFLCDGSFPVIDYDNCIEDGEVNEQVKALLFDTYTEFSPSGSGLHQIAFGSIPHGLKLSGIEMYNQGRFLTFTGRPLAGMPITVADRQEELLAFYAQLTQKKSNLSTESICRLISKRTL